MTFDIEKLIAVIKSVAPVIDAAAPAAVAAAEAVYDFVVSVAPTLGEEDQRKLQQALPALLAKMNRDVDAAIKDLEG